LTAEVVLGNSNMGLDISHDAFSGPYSAFNRFRQIVAKASGSSFPPHEDRSLDEDQYYPGDEVQPETRPGLWEFFKHSDCDGEISPELCGKLADEMEQLLPAIDALSDSGGRQGGYGTVARRFIKGCREAAAANEPLEFC